jgi:hypothetical protein
MGPTNSKIKIGLKSYGLLMSPKKDETCTGLLIKISKIK